MRDSTPPADQPISRGARGILTSFFGFFLIIGIIGAGGLLYQFLRELDTYRWRPTACRVGYARVIERDQDANPYVLEVSYTYSVAGQNFHSTDWGTCRLSSHDYAQVLREAHRLTNGGVECYVSPREPAHAVLARQSLWVVLLVPIPLFFACLGYGGIYAVRRGWFRSSNPAPAADPSSMPRVVPERRDRAPAMPDRPARSSSGGGMTRLAAWALMLMGGAALWFMFVRPAWSIAEARSWSRTPCTIVSSKVRRYESTDDDGRTQTTYRADVLYEYRWASRTYRSNALDFCSFSSSGYSGKAATVDRYPPGLQSQCWVNPRDPYQAVLDREFRPEMYLGLIPGVFLIGGVALEMACRRGRPKRTPSAQRPPEAISLQPSKP